MSFPDVLLMRDRDRFVAYMVEAGVWACDDVKSCFLGVRS